MENWVLFIVFIFPGAVVELLYRRFFSHSKREVRNYEELAKTFVYSLIVFILNMYILSKIYKLDINSIGDITAKLQNIKFLWKYISLTIVTICISTILIRLIEYCILRFLVNKYRMHKKVPVENQYCTIWDEIFENPKNNISNCYVEIFKDGNLISRGGIESYSSPQSGTKELLLGMNQMMEQYMENDKQLPEDKKIFGIIKYEYYDVETGIIIKFYDSQRLLEYWENCGAI